MEEEEEENEKKENMIARSSRFVVQAPRPSHNLGGGN